MPRYKPSAELVLDCPIESSVQAAQKNREYKSVAPRLADGPVDLEQLFDKPGELELDIGFGKGHSVMERASQHPQACLIGIEVKPKWAYRVAEACSKQALGNVRIYAADAGEVLGRCKPDRILSRVFIHFPDPWWKKRHSKRRVINPTLVDDLARLLRPSGELFIQTDVHERALAYRALLTDHPAFALQGAEGWVDGNPYGARSNREIRAERDGLPIWRICAHRV